MLRNIILQKIVQPKQSEFTIVFTVFEINLSVLLTFDIIFLC